jgi:hypothetical protein
MENRLEDLISAFGFYPKASPLKFGTYTNLSDRFGHFKIDFDKVITVYHCQSKLSA